MSKADTSTTVEQPVEQNDFEQLEERIIKVLDEKYDIRSVQHLESSDRVVVWVDTKMLYNSTMQRLMDEFTDENITISVSMTGNTICQKITVHV